MNPYDTAKRRDLAAIREQRQKAQENLERAELQTFRAQYEFTIAYTWEQERRILATIAALRAIQESA